MSKINVEMMSVVGATLIITSLVMASTTSYAQALKFNAETGEGSISRAELRKAYTASGVSNQEFSEIVDNAEGMEVQRIFALADVSGTVGCIPPEPEVITHSTIEENLNFEVVRNSQGKLQSIELMGYVDGPNAIENAVNEPPFNEHPGSFCETGENGEFQYNTPILRDIK